VKKRTGNTAKKRLIPSQLFDSLDDLPFLSHRPKAGQHFYVTAIKRFSIFQKWQPPDDLIDLIYERFPQCDRDDILQQLQFEAEIVRNEILNDSIPRKGLSTLSAQEGDSAESPKPLPVRVSRRKSRYPLRMKRLPDDVSPDAEGFCPLEPVSEGVFLNYWVMPD
jgi:hypothetical protein